MRGMGRAIAGAIVIAVAGCRGQGEAGARADAKADADATRADADVTRADAGTGAGTTGGKACRVMASEGGPAAAADPTGWLDVGAKANFTVRERETGRELRFEGPGRVMACGGDVALVAEGHAVGLPGSGESPGAEQWVATACGVARWASGVHRFTGARDACTLHSSLGNALLYVAPDLAVDELLDGGAPDAGAADAAADPWRRIYGNRTFRIHGRGPLDTPAAVKSALAQCEHAADTVQSLATRMTAPEAGAGNTGALAAESVVARGVARGACAVAAVRVALGGGRPDDQKRIEVASARWRAPR